MNPFMERTGRPVLCNAAASGTQVIEDFGAESMQKGAWIVYTSADSVFQLAAHSDVIPIEEHYRACEVARELCDPYRIGRVIARPFVGAPGNFQRTEKRRDYAFEPDEQTVLGHLSDEGISVYAVGKIEDIFAQRGITESNHTGNNEASQGAVEHYFDQCEGGLIFANFIDFDMLYGHRRDPGGYAKALEQTDAWLGTFLPKLGAEDLLVITADHGNDPTFKGTDHTREHVPLLAYRPGQPGRSLGIREGFYDVAQSLASFFGVAPMPRGVSFL
jgi:phosphopentomutase